MLWFRGPFRALLVVLVGAGALGGLPASEPVPPEDGRGPSAGAPRTGRIALMALGTHKDYRLASRARVDLLVVSPEKSGKGVLKRARKAHPGVPVFAYLNTMDLMMVRSTEKPSFWKEREDWFLHDSDGRRVKVRVRSYKGPRSRYGMNVAHRGWQEYLGARAVEFLKMGYDGVQLDNVETDCSYRLLNVGRWISAMPVEMPEELWYRGEEEMLRVIRAMADEAGFSDREIIFNHIRAGEPERGMAYLSRVDGANAEGWMDLKVKPGGAWGWRSRVELIRRAAGSGKRTNLLARASMHSPEEALFAFASYLMAYRNGRSTFWYGKSYRAEEMRWFWFYETDLGMPAGPLEEVEGTGVFRRSFKKGLVLVNPQGGERVVALEAPYLDEAMESVREVRLRRKEGKLLLKPSGEERLRITVEGEACLADGVAREGLSLVRDPEFSGGAAVRLGDPATVCRVETEIPAGRYRVIVEGRGEGASADAAQVDLGQGRRRVAFGFAERQVYEATLGKGGVAVEIFGAEAGVRVDRIVLVRMGETR